MASNTGNYLATGVTLVNVLPAGVNFLSASNDQGAVLTMVAGAVTSFIGELAPGETATLSITAEVACPAGTTLVDTAKLSATEDDPTPADNWATATTPVRDPSDLSVTMNPGASSVPIGQRLEYTLVVANSGPADEPDARLTIPLPSSVTLVTCSAPSGATVAQDGSQLRWTSDPYRDRQRDDRSRRRAWPHGGRPVDPRSIGAGREREPRPGQRSGIGHRGRDPAAGLAIAIGRRTGLASGAGSR